MDSKQRIKDNLGMSVWSVDQCTHRRWKLAIPPSLSATSQLLYVECEVLHHLPRNLQTEVPRRRLDHIESEARLFSAEPPQKSGPIHV